MKSRTFSMFLVWIMVPATYGLAQQNHVRQDGRFNAVAWIQNSAEYRLSCEQAYRLAKQQLCAGLADPCWSADEVQLAAGDFLNKPPAVILDLDETVLDNSPYNARGIVDGEQYSLTTWNNWCLEEKAAAVPGAADFIASAREWHVKVFFVSNRRDAVKLATINNLRRLGIAADDANVLLRNDEAGRGGDKVSRRAMVAGDHRIVLLIGDNFHDFCNGVGTSDKHERNRVAAAKSSMLGSRWILLPNPLYGGWERALGDPVLRLERDMTDAGQEK